MIRLIYGTSPDALCVLDDNSVDAIVTDPPYGLSFMGKKWDYDVPSVDVWRECLRVLKPGGHLLAFAGTRTQHRMAVRIEDAGFEIRDLIAWVYSTGFPKSLNLDHQRGKTTCGCDGSALPYDHGNKEPQHRLRAVLHSDVPASERAGEGQRSVLQSIVPQQGAPTEGREELSAAEVRAGQPGVEGWGDPSPQERELRSGQVRQGSDVGPADGPSGWVRDAAPPSDGGVVRVSADANRVRSPRRSQPAKQRAGKPSTVAGQPVPQNVGAWETCGRCGLPCVPKGLGTALKPALEPITVARKPLCGTVAENVTTWGTGAINVDGGRVGTEATTTHHIQRPPGDSVVGRGATSTGERTTNIGRFPANLIHDGSDEVVGLFPGEARSSGGGGRSTGERGGAGAIWGSANVGYDGSASQYHDSGSAARFFYCAKASRSDREDGCDHLPAKTAGEVTGGREEGSAGLDSPRAGAGRGQGSRNHHPTVKPTELMRYLCRLVTPPGGVILDPFMGSGSTGRGAVLEGFRFIGVEREADYLEIARARIAAVTPEPEEEPEAPAPTGQMTLFT